MNENTLTLSVVIPTYRRESILVETVGHVLEEVESTSGVTELIVADQTIDHTTEVQRKLYQWHQNRKIRWVRFPEPNLTKVMNYGFLEAHSDIVLFLDDDLTPKKGFIKEHLKAFKNKPGVTAVVGQILQPGEEAEDLPYRPRGSHLRRFLDFPFRRTEGMYIENAMAGNFSVLRQEALRLGGFDEHFTPPVAFRFETEFAKRLIAAGGRIWFEPNATIHHLKAQEGGTRSRGLHFCSSSPRYGVGDYYFALRHGSGLDMFLYVLRRPFREIRTKYHLRHPWCIPSKFLGELRAIIDALKLSKMEPLFITHHISRDDAVTSVSQRIVAQPYDLE